MLCINIGWAHFKVAEVKSGHTLNSRYVSNVKAGLLCYVTPHQLRLLCSSKDTEAKLYAIFIVAINALI